MLVQLQHSYLLINRNALWETGAEAVPIWNGILSVSKLHSESSDLQNTDWKILVIIPMQTGQEHVGLIQGGSIHVLSCVRRWKDKLPALTRTEDIFFCYVFGAYCITSNLEMSEIHNFDDEIISAFYKQDTIPVCPRSSRIFFYYAS